jgi:hypothetical protein
VKGLSIETVAKDGNSQILCSELYISIPLLKCTVLPWFASISRSGDVLVIHQSEFLHKK